MRRPRWRTRSDAFCFCFIRGKKLFSFDLPSDLRLDIVFARFLVARGLAEDLFDGFGGFLATRSGDATYGRFHLARFRINFNFYFRHIALTPTYLLIV